MFNAPARVILGLSLSALAWTGEAAGAPSTPASQPSAQLAGRVEQLLQRLDSDSFIEREAAVAEADQLPLEALPLLEQAIRRAGASPDVRTSLAGVMARLRRLASARSRYSAAVERFRAQYGGQYEQVGEKDPAWDGPARRLLDEAAQYMAARLLDRHAGDAVFDAAAQVRKTRCTDPLVRYLALRFDHQPQLKPLKDLWPAMNAGGYSAYHKASAAGSVVSAAADARRPQVGDRLMVRPFLVAAAQLWPAVLEDPSFPQALAIRQLQTLLDDARRAGIDRQDAFALLDAQLAQALPEESLIRLNVRGHHLVRLADEMRSGPHADVNDDAAVHTMDQAEKILNRCYELYPDDTHAPTTMLWLESFHGRGVEFFDLWFDRAVRADPQNYGAYYKKLTYLEPTSHGSDEQYLEFARQCLAGGHFETRIPLLVVDAHKALADGDEWASLAPEPYFAQPEVWSDIRAAYEGFLRHYPHADGDRYDYARLAYDAGQWATAAEQYRLLRQTPSWPKHHKGLVRLINLELPVRLAEHHPRPDMTARALQRRQKLVEDIRRLTVDAYEAFGRPNDKWNGPARTMLAALTRDWSNDPSRDFSEHDTILKFGRSAMEAGCDDPLVRFGYQFTVDSHVTPHVPAFKPASLDAAKALAASEYPEIIRFNMAAFAAGLSVWFSPADETTAAESRKLLVDITPLIATAIAEKQLDDEACAQAAIWYQRIARAAGEDPDQTWARLRPHVAKLEPTALREVQANHLLQRAVVARVKGSQPAVDGEFRKRLAEARAFAEQLWTDQPDRTEAPRVLLELAGWSLAGRETIEFWFRQSLLVEPYNFDAVQLYVQTAAAALFDVEAVARSAANTGEYASQVPFMLVDYHVLRARRGEGDKLQDLPDVDKISDEDIWADIADVFESYLAKYPLDSDRRSEYASLACRAGRWQTAIRQFQVLGDNIRPKAFGTQDRFDACRNKIAAFTAAIEPPSR